jgi:7-cyano-7-deazaguanosine (preQ0) biosynthesis protein QueE
MNIHDNNLKSNTLVVNEIFGPTFQGEGRNLGMPTMFLRLAGCNLACVWCDTPYTWDWAGKNGKAYNPKEEMHPMTINQVVDELYRLRFPSAPFNLVISGGEPMLQQEGIQSLVIELLALDPWWVEIETAGTRPPIANFAVDQFTVSLKLENSGNPIGKRQQQAAIRAFARDPRSIFKFVVSDPEDFDEIDELVQTYDLGSVCIMPEGITPDKIQATSQAIAQAALVRGYRLTTRLQILLYGNRRAI